MKTNEVYLRHILDAIEQIELYAEDIDKATFEEQRMVQDAVIRQLEIIGEASRQLPEEFRKRHDQVPWHAIIGMRNRIAHEYVDIDLAVVWEVVQYDLPGLKSDVQAILEDSALE